MNPRKLIVLVCLLATSLNTPAQLDLRRQLQEALFEEEVNRDLPKAIEHYEAVIRSFDEQAASAATALYRLGECYRRLGRTNEAANCFEKMVRDFPTRKDLIAVADRHLRESGRATPKDTSSQPAGAADRMFAEIEQLNRKLAAIDRRALLARSDAGSHSTCAEILTAFADPTVSNLVTRIERIIPLPELDDIPAAPPDRKAFESKLGKEGLTALDNAYAELNQRVQAVVAGERNQKHLLELQLERLTRIAALRLAGTPTGASRSDGDLLTVGALETEAFARLLKNSPDLIRAPYRGHETPLQYAIAEGRLPLVEFLLKEGASATTRDRNDRPMLALAAASGHLEIAKLLVESIAGQEPFHLNEALDAAVSRGFTAMTSFLIEAGANVDGGADNGPLFSAIRSNQVHAADLLLKAGADLTARDPLGNQPLHAAVQSRSRGNLEMIKLLLNAGADIEAPGALHSRSRSAEPKSRALHFAVWTGRNDIIELLLEAGADPNSRDSRKATPLHLATALSSAEIMVTLLENGADPDLPGNLRPWTEQPPTTPLGIVFRNNDKEIDTMSILLEGGANPNIEISNSGPRTPLGHALHNHRTDLTSLLLRHGADPDFSENEHPLLVAISRGATEMIQPLIDAGADVNRAHPRNFPLRAAVHELNTNAVAILLRNGADPNLASSADGTTALDELVTVPESMSGASRSLRPGGTGHPGTDFHTIIRAQLINAGASYLTGQPDGLTLLRRENGGKWTVLRKDDHPDTQLTLLEFISQAFAEATLPPQLKYPDLTRITLHRPGGEGFAATNYNTFLLATNTALPDPPLQWGDIVEVPEALPREDSRTTLSKELRASLRERLKREITVICHGARFERTLHPIPLADRRMTSSRMNAMMGGGLPANRTPRKKSNEIDSCWLGHLLTSDDIARSIRHDALKEIIIIRPARDGSGDLRFSVNMSPFLHTRNPSRPRDLKAGHPALERGLGFWLRDGDTIRVGDPEP